MEPQQPTPNDALAVLRAACSPEERKFVELFYQDPNMSLASAVLEAGFLALPKEATRYGENLLRKPTVQHLIAQTFATARDRTQDIRDGTVQALWLLATGWDIKDLVGDVLVDADDDSGHQAYERGILPPDQLPAALRAAVKKVSLVKGRWQYEFSDKAAILVQLLKHFASQPAAAPEPETPVEPSTTVWRPEDDA